ncbi:MAG: peptide ABC transporter ATP-binding protein [Candidatus Latescibacteria bacterium 4484_7]|nr:MAG: peptide ABC transporter ATP-binding protein [Candidatus Latescibacteria bacterium 4484_7]RKZ07244.1 MAG: ABC transporter ATP-binding protein [bacterium]
MAPLLEINNLKVVFHQDQGIVRAVDGLSFSIGAGEVVGLVGESGCGKSVTALSIMRLLPESQAEIVEGEIVFEGTNLLELPEKEMRHIRGNEISIVFQEPLTSLNPVFTCGEQVREAIALHQRLGRKESRERAIEMMRLVRLPDPEKQYSRYPHQLSGGMRQRVMIAMALSCQPKLLIADEPSTALDVSVQAQILELLRDLKERLGMAILLITHDLAVVAQMAEKIVVMYAGVVVEEAPKKELFKRPSHPYTRGLLESLPDIRSRRGRLKTIPGSVPDPSMIPPGCRFSDRCHLAFDRCYNEEPPLFVVDEGHVSRCWLNEEPED